MGNNFKSALGEAFAMVKVSFNGDRDSSNRTGYTTVNWNGMIDLIKTVLERKNWSPRLLNWKLEACQSFLAHLYPPKLINDRVLSILLTTFHSPGIGHSSGGSSFVIRAIWIFQYPFPCLPASTPAVFLLICHTANRTMVIFLKGIPTPCCPSTAQRRA